LTTGAEPETARKNKWNTTFRLDIPVDHLSGLFGQAKTALPSSVEPKFPNCFVNGKHSLSPLMLSTLQVQKTFSRGIF